MSAPFDGPDLLVGEIAAIRTFALHSDGALWPVAMADKAWVDGENEAGCREHQPAGAGGCRCGYWAYGSVAALRDQPAARNVAAVVSCWGRVTPGTRGLRAQFARIDAIWLSSRVQEDIVARVSQLYRHATLYRDRDEMLTAHPLTVLPSYRLPDRRPLRLVAARAFCWVILAGILVAGLPPRSAQRSGWLAYLHTQAAQATGCMLAIATLSYLFGRGGPGARLQFGRMAGISLTLLAWVWSPWVPALWQVLLRAPVVLSAVGLVLIRSVRFVPVRATPPPIAKQPRQRRTPRKARAPRPDGPNPAR